MAVLPKRSPGPISARKKAVPRSVQPVVELKESPELPKCTQGLKPWQSAPNTSMETIGCCSSHKECIANGDCVEKAYHVNYAVVCSLYKHIRKGKLDG